MAARYWNIPPHEWDRMPRDSRAEMMAYSEVDGLIKSYHMQDVTD